MLNYLDLFDERGINRWRSASIFLFAIYILIISIFYPLY